MTTRVFKIAVTDPNGALVAELTLPFLIPSNRELSSSDISNWKVRVEIIDKNVIPLIDR